ncbi:PDR/VanB family oxidoreductase [Nocardia vermiculata]|uniref:Oxidoreductase n=1 Tax=Nocardia vermiculata TaxID=257274 RepID=A0A846Y136_9NOCA|nr:PDR/VanB family oxidoreductase [Nocardia vermiculata]NKY51381.1 oxidoreductase [Nocardia vermiculata]
MNDSAELQVVVAGRQTIALDVVEFELRTPGGEELPPWEPGAHIDVITGTGIVRQYSLCGDPQDRTCYRIAVLREKGGRGGSVWLHEQLRAGDRIGISSARNHFRLRSAPHYLFLAGGIGITPLLPMIRQIAAEGAPWSLYYGGRTRASMSYGDELREFGGGRVRLLPFDDCGLIDLDSALTKAGPQAHVYCCGPEPLIRAVEEACARRAMPLRTERFTPKHVEAPGADTSFTVRIASTGADLVVPAGRSIVDVLVEADVDILTSCEEGTCGTCEIAVLAGRPDHRDSVLTEEEQAASDRILPCVSRSHTPQLILDL